MIRLILVAAFSISLSCVVLCQFSFSPEESSYTEVTEIEGKTQKQLFDAARIWYVETFVDSRGAIEYMDEDLGKIAGKGRFTYRTPADKVANFLDQSTNAGQEVLLLIKTAYKDGKVKLDMDIVSVNDKEPYKYFFNKNGSYKRGSKAYDLFKESLIEIADSFKNHMKSIDEEDEW